jgi:hypothetical protein
MSYKASELITNLVQKGLITNIFARVQVEPALFGV